MGVVQEKREAIRSILKGEDGIKEGDDSALGRLDRLRYSIRELYGKER